MGARAEEVSEQLGGAQPQRAEKLLGAPVRSARTAQSADARAREQADRKAEHGGHACAQLGRAAKFGRAQRRDGAQRARGAVRKLRVAAHMRGQV